MPPAPPTFSMMTCAPSVSDSLRPMMRPSTSVPPPAAKPTTMVTGRVGQVWAGGCAAAGTVRQMRAATKRASEEWRRHAGLHDR